MSKRNQRDERKERQWRQWIGEWHKSGLSVRMFCRLRGFSEPNFYAWRRELRRRDGQSAAFVSVQVVPQVTPASDRLLEVVLAGDRTIRVAAGFDAATLRQLLAVLEEEPSC